MVKAMAEGENCRAYNIADEKSVVSIKEMAELIAEISGVKVMCEAPSEYEKSGYTNVLRGVLNAKELKKLGWTASVHLQEGLRETLAILKNER